MNVMRECTLNILVFILLITIISVGCNNTTGKVLEENPEEEVNEESNMSNEENVNTNVSATDKEVEITTEKSFFSDKVIDGYRPMRYSDEKYDYDLPYRLYIPENYQEGTKYPLVVILHGAGKKGDDNVYQIGMTSAKLFVDSEVQDKYPSFILVPQCPRNDRWRGDSRSGEKLPVSFDDVEPSPAYNMLMGVIDSIEDQYSIDTDRIYLTGQSMGGAGTWYTALANPNKFAAIAPICGWSFPEEVNAIKDLPVWAFHGSEDNTIPTRGSTDIIEALKEAGSTVVKYTEYPGVGHESWEIAYREDKDGDGEVDLITWMFSQ